MDGPQCNFAMCLYVSKDITMFPDLEEHAPSSYQTGNHGIGEWCMISTEYKY